MLQWVEKVLRPYSQLKQSPLVLMLDSFKVHLMESVARAIEDCNCRIFYIPAGTTSRGQVLDVGVNKPFKDRMRREIRSWMIEKGENEKIGRAEIGPMIIRAWADITKDCIVHTFHHIGFQKNVEAETDEDSLLEDLINE
jgi:hypothetical protein